MMKNDYQLISSMLLTCSICKTTATKDSIVLFSEKTAHLHCAQCGYEIVLVSFRFIKTNFGIHFQTKLIGIDTDYDTITYACPKQLIKVNLKNTRGEIIILIDANQ